MSRTAESVVFTPWPPGPEERYTSTLISFSSISMSSLCSTTGTTSTPAKEVCRRDCESKGEIRTKRCVPCSTEIVPYAYGALTRNVVDLIPASSAYEVSNTSTLNSWRSQYRKYMRISISAQSAASTPPASERIVISASRSSYSPLRSVVTSSSLIAFTVASNSISASRSPEPSGSSAANSKRTGRSSTRRRKDLSRAIVDCTLESLLVTA